MRRSALCLGLRERSPPRLAKVVLLPRATLSPGRLPRPKTKRIGSTEHSWRIHKPTRRPRPASTSLDWPGAVPLQARRLPITFSIRPLPLAGAGGSLTSMHRSMTDDRRPTRFLPSRFEGRLANIAIALKACRRRAGHALAIFVTPSSPEWRCGPTNSVFDSHSCPTAPSPEFEKP
jgi:hypothetical protein